MKCNRQQGIALSLCLLVAGVQAGCARQEASSNSPSPPQPGSQGESQAASQVPLQAVSQVPPPGVSQVSPQAAQLSAIQLQQLVAPIALYPDGLIAQILAAATFPDEIVQAQNWMQQNKGLQGPQLAQEVNKQSWDPSVKALTQFPAVLANMNQNLAWTSELGDAYANQQQQLTQAIQTMRQRAMNAGSLKSTPQQTVETQGNTIVIQPANPT